MMSKYEKTINSLIEIKDGFTKGSSKWDKIDVVLREVISIISENETLQRAYNEKKKNLELYEWAFKGIDQAYQKQVEENIELNFRKGK
ncbi:hypothetical protein LI064_02910 [Clostridium perfringens]|uniref:hypothetical protein n=1 Tax=Clostridium perfringens TaxID=1502 RepID=UPI002247C24F|nr:hypothetical protein [Clostridium perfringens]MCX0353473.1 hypothetical protein [Clostridium perfringens]